MRSLTEAELTRAYSCFTPCFRSEAGSSGKDTHGLIRQHQFHKVELVKICTPETSKAEHEALTRDAATLLEDLKLPHRIVRLCSGDISFAAQMCYDLEVYGYPDKNNIVRSLRVPTLEIFKPEE